ncbi:hypothetical protein D3C75_769310 [compost metagenome]
MRKLPDMMPEMVTMNTFVVSVEIPDEFLPVLGFSAHMGTPILYVSRSSIPALTKDFFVRDKKRNITIVGTEHTISTQVEQELRTLVTGTVERLDGTNASDLAIKFSMNQSSQTGMGWGRNRPGMGDAFSFFPADWRYAMLSAPLSHTGKHTPLLPLNSGVFPKEYSAYLEFLKPKGMHPKPPFMHAYLVGDDRHISVRQQLMIEKHIAFEETAEPIME